VGVPKQTRSNVTEEGDDGSDVEKLEAEVHGCWPTRKVSPACLTDRA